MPETFVPPMTLKRRLRRLRRTVRGSLAALRGGGQASVNDALAANPLMFAEKTYNTAHPDYEPLTRGMRAAIPYVDELLPGNSLRSLQQLAEVMGA